MTGDRGIERVLESWFTDGPSKMPDGFLTRVVGRIDPVPQSRLPRLRRKAFTFAPTLNRRQVATAIAMVAIVAVAGGTVLNRLPAFGVLASPSPAVEPSASPSADPSASARAVTDLAQLQATWTSVGTRLVPYKNDSVPSHSELVFGPGTMKVELIGDDMPNAVTLSGSDRLEVTAETGPITIYSKCIRGDLGTYALSLTATGDRLSLTPISDACPSRAAVLTGDWDHTDVGPLAPGQHVANQFRPFGGTTSGSLSYTVPSGWSLQAEDRASFGIGAPDAAVFTSISIASNVVPSVADESCGGGAAAAVLARTPVEVAAWLATRAGLVVSKPTPVTIGGLTGVMVDVSFAPTRIDPCTTPPQPATFISTFDRAEGAGTFLIGGDTRERYILLDRGDGHVLLVDIEAQDAAAWPAVLAAAMPVVNAFDFNR